MLALAAAITLSGAAAAPATAAQLYGTVATLTTQNLIAVAPGSAKVEIGPTLTSMGAPVRTQLTNLAFGDDALYATMTTPAGQFLYAIDPASGAGRTVGTLRTIAGAGFPGELAALAFGNERLYATEVVGGSTQKLLEIDPATGITRVAATLLTAAGISIAEEFADLAFGNGRLYATAVYGGTTQRLLTIDPASGLVTVGAALHSAAGANFPEQLANLAFGDGALYATAVYGATQRLLAIDPTTGLTEVGAALATDAGNAVSGQLPALAFAPDALASVPLPATALLFGAAVAALGAWPILGARRAGSSVTRPA